MSRDNKWKNAGKYEFTKQKGTTYFEQHKIKSQENVVLRAHERNVTCMELGMVKGKD